jgi:hypothetical protein
MTCVDIDTAKTQKWADGRIKYGAGWGGRHPLEELDDELIDAMNYADEAARRGYDVRSISQDLRTLCERVRALLTPGSGQ